MSLWQMSVSAGIMTLVLIVIRTLALSRLPKKTFLLLWGVVLLRLLLPVALPSPTSLYSVLESAETALSVSPASSAKFSVPDAPETGKNLGNAEAGSGLSFSVGPNLSAVQFFAFGQSISVRQTVWMTGFLLCALYFIVCYFRIRRRFIGSLPVPDEYTAKWLAAHPLRRPLSVRQSDRIQTPLSYGVFRPVILLPKGTGEEEAGILPYILEHEYVHVRRFDSIWKILLTSALCLHWFNPLVWLMYILANRDLEISCDEAVVRSLGETNKKDYALALIGMEERRNAAVPLFSHFSSSSMQERIKVLMKYRKVSVPALLISSLLIVSFTALLATSAAAARPETGETPPATFGSMSSGSISPDSMSSGSISSGSVSSVSISSGSALPVKAPSGSASSAPAAARPAVSENTVPSGTHEAQNTAGTVVLDNVELLYYENGWPYLHDTVTNHTSKTIVGIQYEMLAYDHKGQALKLNWHILDSEVEASYENLTEMKVQLAPEQTYDVPGGWSLYDEEKMEGWPKTGSGPNKAAYALYHIRKLTFEDGTVWEDPALDSWLDSFRGKDVSPEILEAYYPHRQAVLFP